MITVYRTHGLRQPQEFMKAGKHFLQHCLARNQGGRHRERFTWKKVFPFLPMGGTFPPKEVRRRSNGKGRLGLGRTSGEISPRWVRLFLAMSLGWFGTKPTPRDGRLGWMENPHNFPGPSDSFLRCLPHRSGSKK